MSRKFSHFIDLLNYRASEQSTKTVFTFLPDGETATESITYQQLDEQAKAIASVLQSYKAEGERALLLYQPGLEFISAFFGCLYAGVIAVPAYPPRANRSLERLQSIITDAQANFTLTTQALANTIEGKLTQSLSTEAIRCITTDNIDRHRATTWQKPQLTGDNLAFLQYTSGSTGIPKGVMVSHGNLIDNSELINRCFQDTEASTGVSWLPPYHDMGLIGGILQPIYVGAKMALMPPVSFLQRPLRWLEAISRYQITTSGAPNFAYELCVTQILPQQRENLNLSSWQLAFTGAEPVRAETLARFAATFATCGFRRQAFFPCYGMAETTLIVSGGRKEALPILKTFDAKGLEQNQVIIKSDLESGNITLVGCGNSADNQEIIIVNPETLKRCSSQEIGEIWVTGKSIAKGYWNRKSQTEEAFNAYLVDSQEGPFLRTGDLGFLEAGELFVTGRLKDLIIIRGRNHYPQDIELTVEKSHPALREGCGAAVSVDIQGEEKLIIIYEVKRSYIRRLNIEEVTAAIRKAVVENHELQPYGIILLKTSSIPKTSSGKIQRHACKAGFLQGSLDIVGEWKQENNQSSQGKIQPLMINHQRLSLNNQQQRIQAWLVNNIAQRLGIFPQEIEISEPFASYGLDSVQAVRLSAELEDWLGRKLPPTLAYDYPNIEALSEFLAQESAISKLTSNQPLKINHQQGELIAIIGLGCRFPGANNPDSFWQLLCEGKDAITQVKKRWLGDDWGGFLEQVEEFDAQFFGISSREAKEMDPQQRLLLEVSWETLENAGIAAEKLAGSATGVFLGISSSDYSQIRLQNSLKPSAYAGTGNAHSIAANRLSYWFDFRGPSLTVDTACSSSLVAVHLAIKSLENGECYQALVGGVNLLLSPELTQTFTEAGMMATDGKCKTFDADADGYVRGEGCGVILLKRLNDAIENEDNILAVIRSSAINQDGRSNGLTAPNGLSQQAVIQQALVNANLNPSQISYIETHGTGTSLGDPIEVNSLKNILLQGRSAEQPLWLGSVKTNIGHLEAAAGIASLIKTVLCLQYKTIPPHLHLHTLNPYIDLKDTPIFIPTKFQPWETLETPRLAGVSSFGFGGTNAHVILEEWIESKQKIVTENNFSPESPIIERSLQILTLSAKNETALKDLVKSYQEYLTSNPKTTLENICFTAHTGRSHFNHRLAIITNSLEDLQKQLASYEIVQNKPEIISGIVDKKNNSSLAFLFTGQGCQYVGMGYQLYQTQPTFRASLERCAAILEPYLEQSLLEILYPDKETDKSQLDETIYTQPALFALEYSLAKLWQSWGIKPSIVMGHSVGEYVAACIAGVFSLDDGLKLVAQRAKLMQTLTQPGKMVAIFTDEITVNQAIQPYQDKVAIAAINGSYSIVISGEIPAIQEIVTALKSQGIKTRKLQVSHGFHSPLMDSMLGEFTKLASQIEYSAPNIDIISNLTGKLAGEEITTSQYWVNHVRQPVKFAQSIECLEQQNYQIFLEIGAKPTLISMGHSLLENREKNQTAKSYLWLPSLRQGYQDWQQLFKSLSLLYVQGIEIDWRGFEKDYPRQRLRGLPTYPFQRQRYWLIDDFVNSKQSAAIPEAKISIENLENCFYQIEWQLKANSQKSTINQQQKWLIFADNNGLGEKIAQQLPQVGNNCFLVYPGDSYQNNKKVTELFPSWIINPTNPEDFKRLFKEVLPLLSSSLKGIIHLWSLEEISASESTLQALETKQILGCGSVLNLIQALYPQSFIPKLWLITRGSQPIDSHNDNLSIAQSPLWGMGKVIALEHPEYWGGMIDLDSNSEINEASLLAREILNHDGEDYLAFRQGKRYVPRLKKYQFSNTYTEKNPSINSQILIQRKTEVSNINSEASYLITGGLGVVGLKVAQWLVKQGAKHLILLGRSEPSLIAKQTIEVLENEDINIFTAQADVANEDDLNRVLDNVNTNFPPLKGIIHAAGILDDGILQGISWKRFNQVLKPKIQGTWNLHTLTQNIPLDFFITFSSVASLLGSPGQGNYAAGNAFLDTISYYRQSQGLPALNINWGPLSDGMAKNTRFAVKGLQAIKTEAGLDSLVQFISANIPQIGIISVDWETLRKQFPDVIQSPYFQEVISNYSQLETQSEIPSLFEQLLAIQPPEREAFLIPYLQSSIAQIMQMDVQQITTTESLLDIGMDSLMVMEAINQLKSDLQLMLYPREFYERPKIEALAKYLAIEFEKSYGTHQNIEISNSLSIIKQENQTPKSANKPILKNKLPGIVFILSSPRSGSTLLRVMLAGHSALSSPPELHLLPFNTMGERSQELALSHLGEGLQRAFMELKQIDAETSQELVAELIAKNTSIPEVYAMLQELAGNSLLIDKSPTYASNRQTLERAEAIFKDAKYIHLVRHPYAVIESFCRLRMDKLVGSGDSNPYKLAEAIWTDSNQNTLDFFKKINPERYYQIHYEELVKQPNQIMSGLCQFLDIPFDPSLLNPYEGERMTDGVYDKSLSVGDPNFLKRRQIDPQLADAWKEIKLPYPLSENTRKVAISLNYELPNDRTTTRAIPTIMEENYQEIRGLKLCLCTWGPADGELILCLHGILEQGAAWSEVATHLAEKGYRVVAPDLRGQGKSDHVGQGRSYNVLDFLGDIDAIVEHLTNKPFTLVGHSLGSVIAAMFASIRPQKVKNLVLVETVLPTEVSEDQAVEQLATHLDYLVSPPEHPIFPDVETAARRLKMVTSVISDELAMQLATRITKPYKGGISWRWDAVLRTRAGIGFNGINKSRYLSLLKRIQAPIILIYGDKSDFNRPEDLSEQQKAMPNAKKFVVSGKHNLHLENSAKLVKIISEI